MKDYKKRLLQIFVPIMLSNLINQAQMLIDRIFLGRMDVLYMTAVGNATPTMWTTMAVVYSMGIGSSILISQSIGEGNKQKAKDYSASMFVFHNFVPIVLFLLWLFGPVYIFSAMGVPDTVMDYCVTYTRIYSPVFLLIGLGAAMMVCLQTSGNTKPFVLYSAIRSGLNIVLDYILIFGKFGFPQMGIAGAALGTVIAEYIGGIYITWVILKDKNLATKPSWKDVAHAKIMPYLKSIKLGINTAMEDFAWNIGNLAIIRILNTISDTSAGVYSIVFSLELISTVVVGAIGNATVTLTGEATGAKDFKTYRGIVKTAYTWAAGVATFSLLMVILFPHQILNLFTTDPEIIAGSVLYLILVAVNMYAKSANIVVGSGIRGSGNTKWMLFTQILGTVGIVTLAYVLVIKLNFGMIGVLVAVLSDEACRALLNTWKFLKVRFLDNIIEEDN